MPKNRRTRANGAKEGGRKPLIPEELVAKLEVLLQNHPSIKSACILAGIKTDLFYAWTAKADLAGANPIYTKFADRMRKAREMGKVSMLRIIQDAARGNGKEPGDWRAASWILERTHSEEFAPKEKVDHRVSGKILQQHTHQHELKAQIVVMLPQAIAAPRPRPLIDAMATPTLPPTQKPA